jgi:hypothetical protein
VFAGLDVLQPATLEAGNLLKNQDWRQSLAIRVHRSQNSNPFARPILERRGDSLLLTKLPGKDAFGAPGDAHKEAFFIHIVHILFLNLVLPHFVMQQFEVGLVLVFAISCIAISVHPGGPSGRKEVLVSV